MRKTINPQESMVIQMALESFITDVKDGLKMPQFNIEAKRELKEMLDHAVSAKEKIDLAIGHEFKLEPLTPEEEKQFLI